MADHQEYTKEFITGLQWMWGEGFLSPGGAAETSEILANVDLGGQTLLDIGCGVGGAEFYLVRERRVGRVVGIDIDSSLIETAKSTLQRLDAGTPCEISHSDHIDFKLVTPGPLPFDDDEFDIVFSKDSMVHITDKRECYEEIRRVLKSRGKLAFGDWFGSSEPPTDEMVRWLDVVGLDFSLQTLESAASMLQEAGFIDIVTRDRNNWYLEYMEHELESISGQNQARLAEAIGTDAAAHRLNSSQLKQTVVRQGQLRPGHVLATCLK